MTTSYYAIVNGAAGGGRCRARADRVLERIADAGIELEVQFTEGPGHATELASEARRRGWSRFISAGGDGTAFEVVNGLFPRTEAEPAPILSILPLGTGNSFLRDFGVAHDEAAIDALLQGRSRRCDVVKVEHQRGTTFYINILGIGFVAAAGELTNRRFKALGGAGYGAAVVSSLLRLTYDSSPFRIDGGELDDRAATFVAFCNSRYTGGSMMMAPDADPCDGRIDVIRVGPLRRRDLLAAFPRIFQGTHVDMHEVEHARAKRIDFELPRRQPVMIDGEILQLTMTSIEALPKAIEVVI